MCKLSLVTVVAVASILIAQFIGPCSAFICRGGTALTAEVTTLLESALVAQPTTFRYTLHNDTLVNPTTALKDVKVYFKPPTWDQRSAVADYIVHAPDLDPISVRHTLLRDDLGSTITLVIGPLKKLQLVHDEVLMFRLPSKLMTCTPRGTGGPDVPSLKVYHNVMNDVPVSYASAAVLRTVSVGLCVVGRSLTCANVAQASVISSSLTCVVPLVRRAHKSVLWVAAPFSTFSGGTASVLLGTAMIVLTYVVHNGLVRYTMNHHWMSLADARAAVLFPNVSIFVAYLLTPSLAMFTCRVVLKEGVAEGVLAILCYLCVAVPITLYPHHKIRQAMSFQMRWMKLFFREPIWILPSGVWIPDRERRQYCTLFDDFRPPNERFLSFVALLVSIVAVAAGYEEETSNVGCRIELIVCFCVYVILAAMMLRYRPLRSRSSSYLCFAVAALSAAENMSMVDCLNHANEFSHSCAQTVKGFATASATVQLLWGVQTCFESWYVWRRMVHPTRAERQMMEAVEDDVQKNNTHNSHAMDDMEPELGTDKLARTISLENIKRAKKKSSGGMSSRNRLLEAIRLAVERERAFKGGTEAQTSSGAAGEAKKGTSGQQGLRRRRGGGGDRFGDPLEPLWLYRADYRLNDMAEDDSSEDSTSCDDDDTTGSSNEDDDGTDGTDDDDDRAVRSVAPPPQNRKQMIDKDVLLRLQIEGNL